MVGFLPTQWRLHHLETGLGSHLLLTFCIRTAASSQLFVCYVEKNPMDDEINRWTRSWYSSEKLLRFVIRLPSYLICELLLIVLFPGSITVEPKINFEFKFYLNRNIKVYLLKKKSNRIVPLINNWSHTFNNELRNYYTSSVTFVLEYGNLVNTNHIIVFVREINRFESGRSRIVRKSHMNNAHAKSGSHLRLDNTISKRFELSRWKMVVQLLCICSLSTSAVHRFRIYGDPGCRYYRKVITMAVFFQFEERFVFLRTFNPKTGLNYDWFFIFFYLSIHYLTYFICHGRASVAH